MGEYKYGWKGRAEVRPFSSDPKPREGAKEDLHWQFFL